MQITNPSRLPSRPGERSSRGIGSGSEGGRLGHVGGGLERLAAEKKRENKPKKKKKKKKKTDLLGMFLRTASPLPTVVGGITPIRADSSSKRNKIEQSKLKPKVGKKHGPERAGGGLRA